MKLHLGCGKRKIYGFINIDINPSVTPDIIDNIFKLDTIKNNSVELIYACHTLEHLSFKDVNIALKNQIVPKISLPKLNLHSLLC